MTCGIYEIWIDKYFYQGSSNNIEKRINEHKRDLKNNKHINRKMQFIWNKYQVFEHQVLVECDKDFVLAYEQDYIDANWGDPKYMNLASNAAIPPSRTGKKQPKESIEKSASSRRKKIICNGIIYKSIADVAKASNVSPGQVSRWLTGTRKTPHNITISYYKANQGGV